MAEGRTMTTLASIALVVLSGISGDTTAADNLSQSNRGELKIEIHTSANEIVSMGGTTSFEVEGVASTIGGVRFIDMMLVLDTSMSLRKSDPDDYRTSATVGLIESLSPKSDTQIGIVGFNQSSELTLPLTSDRDVVVDGLRNLKRKGGTNLAAGIQTALDEFERNGRPGSSRVIMLFTDGMSNKKKARKAAQTAQLQGVAIQTMLLGESLKGGFLLEELAETTGGSFVWVTDPTKLPEAFLNLRTTGVDEVTLSVNGSEPVSTHLAAGTFTGTVPLQVGENRIVALATSLDDQLRESVITVNVRDASCAALEVAALNDGQPALSLDERAVEVVVDASRSMWGQIDGTAKMAVAKNILLDASSWLSQDVNLALRAYGNNSPSDANDCGDSSLLVPFGAGNRGPIRQAISALRPLGQTPIAYALQQAAEDFTMLEGNQTLVLVTDGLESCGGDPIAAARELHQHGIKIHVIGFGFANSTDEDTASLQAIARASDGLFFTANSADELRDALEATIATPYRVYDDSALVANGVLGSDATLVLPMGEYRMELDSVPARQVRFHLAPSEGLKLTFERVKDVVAHSELRTQLPPTSCENLVASRQL